MALAKRARRGVTSASFPMILGLENRKRPAKFRRRANELRAWRVARLICVAALGLAGWVTVSERASAHERASTEGDPTAVVLDLPSVVRLARTRSPTLQVGRAAVAASPDIARAADRVLPTPPRVEVQAGPRIPAGGANVGAEVTVAAWQDLSLGGLGNARRELSSSLAREASAGLVVAEHDAVVQGALAWTEARLAEELERLREAALGAAEELQRVAELRVQSGRADPGEAALAQALVGTARAAVLDAEGRRFVAETELRYFTGLAPRTPVKVAGEFEAKDVPLDPEALVLAVRSKQPDVALSVASAERRERAAEVSVATGKPFLAVGPLVTHEGTGDWIAQVRVATPLPFFNPNAFESARARGEALVARAESSERRARLEADIRMLLHEREHARVVRDALRDGALAPARLALDVASKQYAAGRAELATVLAARRELFDAEQRWAEAVADVWRADVRLSRILGLDPATPLGKVKP
jgi:cobalt-zinc-cadmium efflux system outer membrane protein